MVRGWHKLLIKPTSPDCTRMHQKGGTHFSACAALGGVQLQASVNDMELVVRGSREDVVQRNRRSLLEFYVIRKGGHSLLVGEGKDESCLHMSFRCELVNAQNWKLFHNIIADSLKSITKECYRNSAEEESNSKHISMTLQNFNSILIYDITVTSEKQASRIHDHHSLY